MRIAKKARLVFACLFAVFLLINIPPLVGTFLYSLRSDPFSRTFAGFRNYAEMANNPYFQRAAGNSFRFLLLNVPLIIALSLWLALFFFGKTGAGMGALAPIFVLPTFLPVPAITRVYQLFYAAPFWGALEADWVELIAVSHIYLWKYSGFPLLLLLAALRAVPEEIFEAAALDGAGPAKRLWYITLPAILPSLLFATMLAVTQAFRVYREAYLLFGAYPGDRIYMLQHYINNHFYKLNYQKIAPVSMVVLLASCSLSSALFTLQRKRTDVEL